MVRAVRFLLPGLVALALPAQAAVFTVTKTADTFDGACDRDCSLREAVAAANAIDVEEGEDVVVVPAGVYVLTRTGAGEDANASGDLDLNDPMIVVGAGPGSTILDGFGSDRVLDVRARAEIFGITIRNGRVDGDGGGLLVRPGLWAETILLHRSVVSGNLAQHGGDGGGIAAFSSLEVRESAVLENHAEGEGGGIASGEGLLTVRNVTVSGNLAHGSGGGLYYVVGAARIASSTIVLNRAHVSGGGIAARFPPFPGDYEPDVWGSIVAQNTASEGPDCGPGAASYGYNAIGVGEGCAPRPTDRSGTAAQPLRVVSETLSGGLGPTPVHVPLENSPALDLVPFAHCPPGDQVGHFREMPCDAGALERIPGAYCFSGGPVLCLQGHRFRVTAAWRTAAQAEPALGQAVELTQDTGTFWFFAPDNLEILVKVLNGCAVNGQWWVFTSGLTDVGVTLQVEDMGSRRVWSYTHPPGGTYAPRLDTGAFPCFTAQASATDDPPPSTFQPSRVHAVTWLADSYDGLCNQHCSLRDAVDAANARGGTNVIVLEPDVYGLGGNRGQGEDAARTGDLDVTGDLVLLGAGAGRTILDGAGLDRVLDVLPGGSLELHGVTVRNGWALPDYVTSFGDGGGIRARGPLRVVRSLVESNRAEALGGGIYAFGEVAIRDSTISGNTAGSGGGLFAGLADLENVTLSGNTAQQAGGGFFLALETASLRHVTIAGNTAHLRGGGLAVELPECPIVCWGPFVMQGTVIAGNSSGQSGDAAVADCFDLPLHEGGANLFGIGTRCNPGLDDRAGTPAHPLDPRLGPPGDHGGSTPTRVPFPGSPLVDLVSPPSCPAADQRGRPRPAGGGCDAGAVELQPGACQPDGHTLCLGANDRFQVTARWTTGPASGSAGAVPLALDTGSFWFFQPENVELMAKVLDGCGVNGRFWVFLTGMTDVGVEVEVRDTATGRTWTHAHPAGTPLQPRLDTDAFSCAGS